MSTTAYIGVAGDGRLGIDQLSYIPLTTTLPNGRRVTLDAFTESEWKIGQDLMNQVIRDGNSWPFEIEFSTIDEFRSYFLSHVAFCVKDTITSVVLGFFYIKPNFPGRCKTVCNGGFITAPEARRQGVARFMGTVFLMAARDLGYCTAYFNLVFASNISSVRLWESLGFHRVATLPKTARLRGMTGLDTAYGYWYDLDTLPNSSRMVEQLSLPPPSP